MGVNRSEHLKRQIKRLKERRIGIISKLDHLYKLSTIIENCEIIHNCECVHYICKYNTKHQNELEKNISNKKQFRTRHQKYIYKIAKTIDCYYKELKSIEKQLLKIHTIDTDMQITDTPFYELLLLGKELFNEQVC